MQSEEINGKLRTDSCDHDSVELRILHNFDSLGHKCPKASDYISVTSENQPISSTYPNCRLV